jgi:hypothetical protein
MSNNNTSDKQPPSSGTQNVPGSPQTPQPYTRPEPTSMPPDLATVKKGLDQVKKGGG